MAGAFARGAVSQGADVIEMGVGENDRVERPIGERAKIRERLLSLLFRMHAGIEDEALARGFETITIRADLGPAREIGKFQQPER